MWYQPASKKHVSQERIKARKLKKTQWWLNLLQVGKCEYCGENFDSEDLTMDHRIPVVRGGKSTKSNVVVACRDCNSNKKAATPAELILDRDLENL